MVEGRLTVPVTEVMSGEFTRVQKKMRKLRKNACMADTTKKICRKGRSNRETEHVHHTWKSRSWRLGYSVT